MDGNSDNIIFAVKALQLVDNIRSFRTINTFLTGKIFDQNSLFRFYRKRIFAVAICLIDIIARCKGNGRQTQEQKILYLHILKTKVVGNLHTLLRGNPTADTAGTIEACAGLTIAHLQTVRAVRVANGGHIEMYGVLVSGI